jgi:hypothetical protein
MSDDAEEQAPDPLVGPQTQGCGSGNDADTKPAFEVSLQLQTTRRVNFASAQNDVPVLKLLSLTNTSEIALEDLDVTLDAKPPVIRTKTWKIDRLSAGQSLDLHDLSTPLDIHHLSGLNETEIGSLTLTVTNTSGPLIVETRRLELLARDQWGGVSDMGRLLAAFVSPNDAVVAAILKEASLLLERSGQDGSMEGYQIGPMFARRHEAQSHSVAPGLRVRRAMTLRQSRPSNKASNWAFDNRITPSCILGQANVPCSSRL